MSQTNGHVTRESLQESRREYRKLLFDFHIGRLKRTNTLMESLNTTLSDYWVSIFSDRLERFKTDPQGFVVASYWDRRYGRNIPFFQTEHELAMLRMQARILCATNAYAAGLVEGLTSYVIGNGFTYRATTEAGGEPALVKAVQTIIDNFLERNEWYGGEQPGLEEELFWRSCEDGEFFLIHFCRDDGLTTVRTVEPEQVSQPPSANINEWLFGIHTPEDDVQSVLGYWIYFGTDVSGGKEYSPKVITHFRRNVKRSIKRGLTDFAWDTKDALEIASKLRRNMALGAAIQASYAGIRQHEGYSKAQVEDFQDAMVDYERTNPVTGEDEKYKKYDPGMVDIPKGMQFVQPPSASNAAAHVEILQACLRGAGVRWNAPEWLPSADASNNNYASSLTAESPFVKTIIRRQRGYKTAFLRSIWLAVENYVSHNRGLHVLAADENGIKTEKYFTLADVKQLVEIQVEAPNPTIRDRLQEANRNQILRMNGVLSPQTWSQQESLDYDQEQANLEEHNERTGQLGSMPLPLPIMAKGGHGGQGQQQGGPGGQSQAPPTVAGGWTQGGGLQESVELTEAETFFARCDRDKEGRCQGEGGSSEPTGGKKAAKGTPVKKKTAGTSSPPIKIKPVKTRAFTGRQVEVKAPLSKQEAGKIGEQLIVSWLHSQGMKDARPMNLDRNNFPIDLIQDHEVIEVKTGSAGNGPSAQQWRLTIGEPGKEEKSWLASVSDQEKAEWNAQKQKAITDRKKAVLDSLGKELGKPVKAATMTVILNHDTKTADIYKFAGWHDRIGWNSETARSGYVGSVRYG